MQKQSSNKIFGGLQEFWQHDSQTTNSTMCFSIFLPPQALAGEKCPALYFLSGLTCTAENATVKAGFQRKAAELGLIIISPDTSPRESLNDTEVADADRYDLGKGAGFYINATQSPWEEHYQMESYIIDELPSLIRARFPIDENKVSITGHSMGGHGALTLAIKYPEKFQSVSAFAPIVNPSQCQWGQDAFSAYLGEDQKEWAKHDATKLIQNGESLIPCLISQGSSDNFLAEQLLSENLLNVCQEKNIAIDYNLEQDYDHSYYFISSFIDQHLEFHSKQLKS